MENEKSPPLQVVPKTPLNLNNRPSNSDLEQLADKLAILAATIDGGFMAIQEDLERIIYRSRNEK
jgi:hypothetical protein